MARRSSVVALPVALLRAVIVADRAEDAEVAVQMDVDLTAVRARYLDLVVALLVPDLNEERAEIAACTREVSVETGATLATQGENAYEFFVIETGEAEVRRDGDVIATLRAGDVVGEIGLLVTGRRTASIVATTPMTLVAMFSREFKADREPGAGHRREPAGDDARARGANVLLAPHAAARGRGGAQTVRLREAALACGRLRCGCREPPGRR